MQIPIAALSAAIMLTLTACSSSSPPTIIPDGGAADTTTADPAAVPRSSSASTAEKWCALQLGDSKAHVREILGAPNTEAPPGLDSLAWKVDGTIYLATFEGDAAFNLQAYEGAIGPVGAAGLSCEAFRN